MLNKNLTAKLRLEQTYYLRGKALLQEVYTVFCDNLISFCADSLFVVLCHDRKNSAAF
jgi:hypothetical protein